MKKRLTSMILLFAIILMINPGCNKKEENNNVPPPETSFTLAQVGHHWVYRITNSKALCDYDVEVTKDLGNGVYELFYQKGNCSWAFDSYTAYMYCTPEEWGSVSSLNPLNVQTNLRTDATVGTKYTWIDSQDTIIVTVLRLDDPVTVPAGSFNSVKVMKEGKMHPPGDTTDFAVYYWITYNYGLVKIENIFGNPGMDQELVSANW